MNSGFFSNEEALPVTAIDDLSIGKLMFVDMGLFRPTETVRGAIIADYKEIDFAESDPGQYAASSEGKNLAIGLACLIVIGVEIWFGWYGWGFFQRIGWIPQIHVIDIRVSGDWLTGEFRACQTDGVANVLVCPKSGDSLTALAPIGEASRSFSVSFYGNLTGKLEDVLHWKCKRKPESISCRAVP